MSKKETKKGDDLEKNKQKRTGNTDFAWVDESSSDDSDSDSSDED